VIVCQLRVALHIFVGRTKRPLGRNCPVTRGFVDVDGRAREGITRTCVKQVSRYLSEIVMSADAEVSDSVVTIA
jgi:hypothetical protein